MKHSREFNWWLIDTIKLIIISILLFIGCDKALGQDSTQIKQEVFESLGKYALLTTNGSSYDNVVHGSLEFVESQKENEFQKAWQRRKPLAIVTIKCK